MRSSGPWPAPGASLGIVPLESVRPDVRALARGRSQPLRRRGARPMPAPGRCGRLEPRLRGTRPIAAVPAAWTLAAAGDVMLDREVHRQAVLLGKGPDHPWDGGFAEITARTCCTADGGNAIETRRTGRRGAVRRLLTSADVAVVNHEGPAPDDATYHPAGLVFTFDPDLLEGVLGSGHRYREPGQQSHPQRGLGRGPADEAEPPRRPASAASAPVPTPTSARRPTCLEPGGGAALLPRLRRHQHGRPRRHGDTSRGSRAAPARRAQRHPPPATGWRRRHRRAAPLGRRVHDPRPAPAASLGSGHGARRRGRRPGCPLARRRTRRVHRRRARPLLAGRLPLRPAALRGDRGGRRRRADLPGRPAGPAGAAPHRHRRPLAGGAPRPRRRRQRSCWSGCAAHRRASRRRDPTDPASLPGCARPSAQGAPGSGDHEPEEGHVDGDAEQQQW